MDKEKFDGYLTMLGSILTQQNPYLRLFSFSQDFKKRQAKLISCTKALASF